MKVTNMRSNSTGREVPNQFIITDEGRGALGNFTSRQVFQSHDSIIAIRTEWEDETKIQLDIHKWDYSTTTDKYRNQFLGEKKADTQRKIDSGEYKLVNLNS